MADFLCLVSFSFSSLSGDAGSRTRIQRHSDDAVFTPVETIPSPVVKVEPDITLDNIIHHRNGPRIPHGSAYLTHRWGFKILERAKIIPPRHD